jgi:redox-sensitive bicupin YhaK (pirin superfamily)
MQTQARSQTSSPTLTIRRSGDRGTADHGWLQARFTFSFADYHDPAHMGYRSLRVINNDTIAPGGGFPSHPHRSMEIFTYVISGQLEHRDSMGNGRVIEAGEFQYMSAGSGVVHSEFNPSQDTPTELLQIWITPQQSGGEPRYGDMNTNQLKKENSLTLFASQDGRGKSFAMRQNAEIYFGHLSQGHTLTTPASNMDGTWLHLIKGRLSVLGETLEAGDSASVDGSAEGFPLEASADAEFLLFKLA